MFPFPAPLLCKAEDAGGGGYGAHRYWRIFVTQNAGSSSFTAISEIEFHSSVGGADITGSGTPISGGSGSDGIGNEAAKAFNNTSTDWARSSATNTWIGYDFGSAVTVSEFVLTGSSSGFSQSPQSFTLDYSDDGVTWVTATDGAFTAYGWLVSQQRTYPEVAPASGYHRMWRIFCTDNNGNSGSTAIVEAEFRATPGGADQTVVLTSNNGNATGRIVGSSISNSTAEGYRAFNNSTSSWWIASGTTNQWVGFIFPSPITVQEAMVQGTSDNRIVKNGKVDWSDDGSTWTTAGTFSKTGWTANEQIFVTVTP